MGYIVLAFKFDFLILHGLEQYTECNNHIGVYECHFGIGGTFSFSTDTSPRSHVSLVKRNFLRTNSFSSFPVLRRSSASPRATSLRALLSGTWRSLKPSKTILRVLHACTITPAYTAEDPWRDLIQGKGQNLVVLLQYGSVSTFSVPAADRRVAALLVSGR